MAFDEGLLEVQLPDNFVHLVGTVKRDEDAKKVRSDFRVIDFCLCVPSMDTGNDVFVDCYAYGDIVDEELEGFVTAGETLEVYGRMTFRSWTSNNGMQRSGKVVVIDHVLSD